MGVELVFLVLTPPPRQQRRFPQGEKTRPRSTEFSLEILQTRHSVFGSCDSAGQCDVATAASMCVCERDSLAVINQKG